MNLKISSLLLLLSLFHFAYPQTEEFEGELTEVSEAEFEEEEEEEEGSYLEAGETYTLPYSEFINNYGQGYVTEAVNYITQKAIEDGKIANSTYTVKEVLSLTEEVNYIQNIQTFNFHVFAESADNLTDVHIWFALNLAWINGGGLQQVEHWNLSAYSFETESFTEDASEFAQEEADYQSLLPELNDLSGFIAIDWQDSDQDQHLQNLLNSGFNYVVEKEIQAGEFAPVEYTIGIVHNVTVELGQGIFYYFSVDANSIGTSTAILNFIIIEQPWSGLHVVTSYEVIPDAGE